ncbi:hypothetical protein Tco_1320289 [Tanacetum coccineum]
MCMSALTVSIVEPKKHKESNGDLHGIEDNNHAKVRPDYVALSACCAQYVDADTALDYGFNYTKYVILAFELETCQGDSLNSYLNHWIHKDGRWVMAFIQLKSDAANHMLIASNYKRHSISIMIQES